MITITERKATPLEIEENRTRILLLKSVPVYFEPDKFMIAILWLFAGFCSILFFPLIKDIAEYFNFLGKPIPLIIFGLFFITLLSLPMILVYKYKLNQEEKTFIENESKALDDPGIEVKTISNIEEVWEIGNFDFTSAGFLFRTAENEYFSLFSQSLFDYYPEEDELFETDIISQEIIFEKWIASGTQREFKFKGDVVPKSGYISITKLVKMDDEDIVSDFFKNDLNQFPSTIETVVRENVCENYENLED